MLARLKFDISKLVNELLDQIPQDLIVNGRVLDLAIGGGQFVAEVERRKRAAGKTDDEIKNSVYGFESNILRLKFAVNKNKLVGTYQVSDLKELDSVNMKFDVIVGNPPYEDSSLEGGQNKMYTFFCKKSFELLNKNGVIAFVTPTSVLKKSKRFSLVNQSGLKVVDFTSNDYFQVGIKICSWVIDKNYTGDVLVKYTGGQSTQSSDNVIYDYSTVNKDFTDLYEGLKDAASTPDKRMFRQNNFGPALSKVQDSKHRYPLYKLEKGNKVLTYWSSRVPYFVGKNKMSLSMTKGFNKNAIIVDTDDFDVGYLTIEINSQEEVDNIKSFIFSEYFQNHCELWKQVDGYGYTYGLKYLPPFDKTRKWTNSEVKKFLESFSK